MMQGRQGGTGSLYCGQNSPWYRYSQTLTRLTFTAGDGTEFELRDQLTSGQPKNPVNCTTGFNRGKVFVTADGSAATFISDADVKDAVVVSEDTVSFLVSGYLLLRDGTRYRIDTGTITWMRDRNGNKLSFLYDSFKRITSVTDSLNRQITVAYAAQTPGSDVVTYKGFGGVSRTVSVNYDFLQNALRSDQILQTPKQLFPDCNGSSTTNYNPTVIKSVTLPNNQQYQLSYNSYGEVARAVLPTSAAMEYDYAAGLTDGFASGSFGGGPQGKHVYRRVIERRVYPGGESGSAYESKMTYSRPETTTTNLGYVVTDQCTLSGITGQCGSAPALLARQQHYLYGSARSSFTRYQSAIAYDVWNDGREYQTDAYDMNGTIVLQRAQHIFAQRAPVSWWTGTAETAPPNDVRLTETTTTIEPASTNLVSKRIFGYDDFVSFNNQSDLYEYDFGTGAAGSLVRRRHTDYVTAASYTDAFTGAHIRSLASQVSVYDAAGTERARATTEYDNYNPDTNHAALLPRSSISGLDSAYTTSYTTRGNATATTRYLLVNGSVNGSVTAYAQYDIAGNAVKAIDARGNATRIAYDDCFGAPDNNAQLNSAPLELSSVGQISYAFPTLVTNAMSQRSYAQFDYYLGRPVNGEDSNGVIASGYYNDLLDRPTQIRRAIGTPAENQITFSYDDPGRVINTTSDLNTNNDNALVGKVLYDALGRTTETRQYEGGTNYISVQTQYDVMGRAFKTSNPFRPWQSETAVWTSSAFDALSRVISVTTPDAAVAASSYSGNTVTVTDQAGKARKSVTDALGRLATVYEDPSGLNYSTSYSYDVLDSLTTVSQGVQTRTFAYDSLKRLTSASNPESGTVGYSYDDNGNLTSKTDVRSITTSYVYDPLNRATSCSYSDGTPTVTYTYDSASVANSKGRLTAVSSSVSATNYLAYDALGRIKSANQVTDSQTYSMTYGYNLAGGQTSMRYPSGRVITSEYDEAGRLAGVRDQSSGVYYAGAASTDATNRMQYGPQGALSVMKLGNGLWEHTSFNNRLQPTQIGLGTSGTDSSTMGLSYSYGTTSNNGNVQSVSYSGGGLSYTQNFGYDAVNRLSTSNENSGSSWSQTNGYDQYGNRWIDYGGGVHNLSFSPVTNRITNSGYAYDAAGNLINDSMHSYGFDGENKVKTVDGVSGVYGYDGDGNRVRKNFALGDQLRLVYSGGQLLAEYDLSTGALKKEYVYGAKGLIATIEPSTGTRYTTSDHLGSPRVVTNSSAGVVSRHDFMPFGEELGATVGGRTAAMGFGIADG
ncbi:MAG: hypothetical protein QOG23_4299 [Blastocatellia bacterium]|jgi:YD repeat-containing protein|nr:hypothetical protein [Blastocatellia bacterium]